MELQNLSFIETESDMEDKNCGGTSDEKGDLSKIHATSQFFMQPITYFKQHIPKNISLFQDIVVIS